MTRRRKRCADDDVMTTTTIMITTMTTIVIMNSLLDQPQESILATKILTQKLLWSSTVTLKWPYINDLIK